MSEFAFQPRDFDRDIRLERDDLSEYENFELWDSELPPGDVWLVNPARQQFETPTDKLGRVDVRSLVALGRATIDESYEWPIRPTRDDHLCWPETPYRQLAWKLDNPLPMVYRNMPLNKARFPLEFERWKHTITIPPDFPSLEVMEYSVEAWGTARDLYLSVGEAVQWTRLFKRRSEGLESGKGRAIPSSPEDVIGNEFLIETLAARVKGADLSLQRHHRLPEEFQIIKPGDNARRILQVIGYQVRHGCRDGVRSRESLFIPPKRSSQELLPAA